MVISRNIPTIGNNGIGSARLGIRQSRAPQAAISTGRVNQSNPETSHTGPQTGNVFVRKTEIAGHLQKPQDNINPYGVKMEWHIESMENARELAKAEAERLRKMQIAMEIAARIMRGDIVPPSDKDFLLEQSPGMYKLAMSSRNHNNGDPEEHAPLATEKNMSAPEGALGQHAMFTPSMQGQALQTTAVSAAKPV